MASNKTDFAVSQRIQIGSHFCTDFFVIGRDAAEPTIAGPGRQTHKFCPGLLNQINNFRHVGQGCSQNDAVRAGLFNECLKIFAQAFVPGVTGVNQQVVVLLFAGLQGTFLHVDNIACAG